MNQVPQVDDPAGQKYLAQLAAAMDGRSERLGRFTAQTAPDWAVTALGAVPDDVEARAQWERLAAPVAAYRELYAWDSPSEPIGPEPAMATPEKRAAWHAAAEALGRPADGADLCGRDTGSLLLIRDTYAAETAWAPRFVGPELRAARTGAREAEFTRARAAAEARAAEARGDQAQAERQRGLADSAVSLRTWYEQQAAMLEQADADYTEYSHATEGSRRLAAAADAELRRRDPRLVPEPLRPAEPERVTDAERAELARVPERGREYESPGWIRRLRRHDPRSASSSPTDKASACPTPTPRRSTRAPRGHRRPPSSATRSCSRQRPRYPPRRASPGRSSPRLGHEVCQYAVAP